MESSFFPGGVCTSSLIVGFCTFLYLYLDLARRQLCFLLRKMCKWEKWKYQDTIFIDSANDDNQSIFLRTVITTVNKLISFRGNIFQFYSLFNIFRRNWKLWELTENLQPLRVRIMNIPGATWHKTQTFPDHKRIVSLESLRKSKVD